MKKTKVIIKKEAIKFRSEQVQRFEEAVNSLVRFNDLLCESKYHHLAEEKESIIKNLQPIKRDLSRFLEVKKFEIAYTDPLVEQGHYRECEINEIYTKKAIFARVIPPNNNTFIRLESATRTRTLEEFYGFIKFVLNDTIKYVTDPKNLTPKNQEIFTANRHSCHLRISRLIEILDRISNSLPRHSTMKDPTPKHETIKDFIRKYCDLSQKPDVNSKCEMLMREHRNKKISLPLVKAKYRRGQRKLYHLDKLLKNWPSYRMTLTTLPPLKESTDK